MNIFRIHKYMNKNALSGIVKTYKTDPFLAKSELEKYLVEYPHDYFARNYYVSLLIKIGEIDAAKEEYKKLITESNIVGLSKNKMDLFKKYLYINKARLLSMDKAYSDLLTFSFINKEILGEENYNRIKAYCDTALCITDNHDSYICRQFHNYDAAQFYEHVQKHAYLSNQNTKRSNAVFANGTNFLTLIDSVKEYLPSNQRFYKDFFLDEYYFKYNNCGFVDNQLTDYFKVICIRDTNNIITMCPVTEINVPYIDLKIKQDKNIVKKLEISDEMSRRQNLDLLYSRRK